MVRRSRRTGELTFYRCYSPLRPAGHLGHGPRDPLASRGKLPGRQGPGRTGRALGPPLGLLVPVGDLGHAPLGLPVRHRRLQARQLRRQPARSRSPATRSQRCSARWSSRGNADPAPAVLVYLAKAPLAPRQNLPLPAVTHLHDRGSLPPADRYAEPVLVPGPYLRTQHKSARIGHRRRNAPSSSSTCFPRSLGSQSGRRSLLNSLASMPSTSSLSARVGTS